jgi:hypothetical protein
MDGFRSVRRISNWTAATLIVGTGAAAVALAHQASHTAAAPAPVAAVPGTAVPAGASTPRGVGPRVTHSVATTTASGVTVTTTTSTVNGKTAVTRVRHVPATVDD